MEFANIEDVFVTNTGRVTVVTLKCLVTAVFVKMEALVDWGNVFVHPPIPGTDVEFQLKTCRNWLLVTNWLAMQLNAIECDDQWVFVTSNLSLPDDIFSPEMACRLVSDCKQSECSASCPNGDQWFGQCNV